MSLTLSFEVNPKHWDWTPKNEVIRDREDGYVWYTSLRWLGFQIHWLKGGS